VLSKHFSGKSGSAPFPPEKKLVHINTFIRQKAEQSSTDRQAGNKQMRTQSYEIKEMTKKMNKILLCMSTPPSTTMQLHYVVT